MKRILLLTFLNLLISMSNCQQVVDLSYGFDNDQLQNGKAELISLFQTKKIERIEYHYSAYRLNPSFDQEELNRKRKADLYRRYEDLINPLIQWRNIVNYDCNSPEECEVAFHGYRIFFVEEVIKTREEELKILEDYFTNQKKQKEPIFRDTINKKEKILIRSVWDDRVGWVPDTARIVLEKIERQKRTESDGVRDLLFQFYEDDAAILIDVTQSMSDYSTALMDFMSRASKDDKNMQVGIFNDGNGKPNHKKELGKTGGVYFYEGSNAMDFYEKNKKYFFINSKDMAENDAEAILETEKKFDEASSIIVLVDNYSPVRDFVLFKDLSKPIHVILCNAEGKSINNQYLSLAMLTNGSINSVHGVHFFNEEVKEGTVFKFNNQTITFGGWDERGWPIWE